MISEVGNIGYGGVSILHAAGCGWGCSLPLDLTCNAEVSSSWPGEYEDPNGLLKQLPRAIEETTGAKIHHKLGVSLKSDIPRSMGLKSSSAACVSALRAVSEKLALQFTDYEVVDIAAKMQIMSGCSMTGSFDDNWAALGYNTAIIDAKSDQPSHPVAHFQMESKLCTIILRGHRSNLPNVSEFAVNKSDFLAAKNALVSGDIDKAMRINGLAVAKSTMDSEATHILTSLHSNGLTATLTGSGPCIAILHNEAQSEILDQIISESSKKITTKVLQHPPEEE